MKRIATFALSVAATFLITGIARAEQHVDKVTVPFNFTVNDTTLPAGSYTIATDSVNPAILTIRDQTQTVLAVSIVMNDPYDAQNPATLTFHQYGGQFFLSMISFATPSDAVYLPASRLERQARYRAREAGIANVTGD